MFCQSSGVCFRHYISGVAILGGGLLSGYLHVCSLNAVTPRASTSSVLKIATFAQVLVLLRAKLEARMADGVLLYP